MTIRQLPPFAGRLLRYLVPGRNHDALLGDIAEEAPRRSRLWFLSQIAAAILVGSWRDVRKHRLLALRAIATGCAALTVYFGLVAVAARVVQVLSNGGYYVGGIWLTLPRLPGPPLLYGALAVLTINALGFVLSGWAIVRLHRAHGITMALPFLIVMTVLALVPLTIVATDTGPGTRSMPLLEMLGTFGTMFLSIPGGVLLGGALGVRWKRT